MWRNRDVVGFLNWLKARNDAHTHQTKVRFYGLDLYSLRASMEAVVHYLDDVDPEAAALAQARYSCFDHVLSEGSAYGEALALNVALPCERQVIDQLVDLRRRSAQLLARDGWVARDEFFVAEQNARLVRNAEVYYREMYQGTSVVLEPAGSTHMAGTLEALVAHLDAQLGRAKLVIWEHNSHVGDARATEMGQHGELNVGQLARTRWPGECLLVGFTTHHGQVTAASEWGGPADRKHVRPALAGSYEELFHQADHKRFLLPLNEKGNERLAGTRLERGIGVIYRPQTERASHYFHARLDAQFDAVIHIDRTSAVEPLERTALWDQAEPPETFPTGL